MPAPKSEQRKVAIEWMGMSTKERFDKGKPLNDSDMQKSLDVKRSTWNGWIKQYEAEKKRDVIMLHHPMVVGENPPKPEVIESMGEVDAEQWAKDRAIEWLEATLASAKNGVAASQKLLAQIANMLVEQQEVKHTILSAEDVSRIEREADRKIRELNTGTGGVSIGKEGVPKERPLLPEKIREDKK